MKFNRAGAAPVIYTREVAVIVRKSERKRKPTPAEYMAHVYEILNRARARHLRNLERERRRVPLPVADTLPPEWAPFFKTKKAPRVNVGLALRRTSDKGNTSTLRVRA